MAESANPVLEYWSQLSIKERRKIAKKTNPLRQICLLANVNKRDLPSGTEDKLSKIVSEFVLVDKPILSKEARFIDYEHKDALDKFINTRESVNDHEDIDYSCIWETYSNKTKEKLLNSKSYQTDLIGVNKSRLKKCKEVITLSFLEQLRNASKNRHEESVRINLEIKALNFQETDPAHQSAVREMKRKAKKAAKRDRAVEKRFLEEKQKGTGAFSMSEGRALYELFLKPTIKEAEVNHRRVANRLNRARKATLMNAHNLEKEEKKEFSLRRMEKKKLNSLKGNITTQAGLFVFPMKMAEFIGKSIEDKSKDTVSSIAKFIEMNQDQIPEFIRHNLKFITSFVFDYTYWVAFLYQLYRSRSRYDIAAAIHQFLYIIAIKSKNFIQLVVNFGYMFQVNVTPDVESGYVTDKLTDLLSFCKRVVHSDIVKLGKELMLSIVSFKLFSKDVADGFKTCLGSSRKVSMIEFIEQCFTVIDKFLHISELLDRGVPFSEALFANNPMLTVINESRELLYYSDKLYTGVAVEGQMSCSNFIMKSEKTLKVLESLCSMANPVHSSTIDGRKTINSLKESIYRAKELMNSVNRVMPFGVCLYGDPGIGKSKILNLIADIWCNMKGRDFDPAMIFHRIVTSDYWEGYQPYSQLIVHYSELGSAMPKIAAAKGDKPTAEINSLMDTLPFFVDMAFGEKGKTSARPELVLADANDPYMNIDVLYKNSAAVRRRFLYIQPIVKDEFRKLGSVSLDVTKSLQSEVPEMDRWWFRVHRFSVLSPSTAKEEVLMERGDVYELVKLLFDLFKQHDEEQQKIIENDKKFYDSSSYVERPIEVQSGVYDNVSTGVKSCKNLFAQAVDNVNPYIDYFKQFTLTLVFMMLLKGLLFQFWVFTPRYPNKYKTRALITLSLTTLVMSLGCYSFVDRLFFLVLFLCFTMFLLQNSILSLSLPTVVCRGLYKYYKNRMTTLLNFRDGFIKPTAHYKLYGASIAACLATIAFLKYFFSSSLPKFDDNDISAQSSSTFYLNSPVNSEIQKMEETYACSTSYERIPNKNSQIWNVQHLDTTPSVHKGTPQELYRSIASNIRPCIVNVGREKPNKTYICGLKGNIAFINFHAINYPGKYPLTISASNTGSLGEHNQTMKTMLITEQDVYHYGEDFAVIVLRQLFFKDITKHFATINMKFPSYEGCVFDRDVIINTNNFPQRMNNPIGEDVVVSKLLNYKFIGHFSGMCGIPVVAQVDNGSAIVGFHAGGSPNDIGWAIIADSKIVEESISRLESNMKFMPLLSRGSIQVQSFVPPIAKSAVRYEVLHGLKYYGKLEGNVDINQKSKLKKTLVFEEVTSILEKGLNYEQKKFFGKPMMIPTGSGENYISPYNNALKAMTLQKTSLDSKLLSKVVDLLVKHIINNLKLKNIPQLSPWTVEVAVNGYNKDAYAKRMNVRAAAGFDFKGLKMDYLPITFEEPGELIREPVDCLKQRLFALLCEYNSGFSPMVIYNAKLKDEPRPVEKINTGKTRVYYASPIDNLIISKMFLGPFYTLMTQFNDIFCCTVGINMFSGVDDLVKYFKWPETMMEGDYESFDISTPYDIAYAASTVIYQVLKDVGYNEDSLQIVQGLLTGQLHPLINMLKDVFEVAGQQPSGKSYTTEDNCLRNLIMLMYAWYSTSELKDKDFFNHLRPKTNGDDMLVSVDPCVGQFFNNQTYQKICKVSFGINYTSADKSPTIKKFLHLDDCSYLKRNFVFDTNINRWKAPLDVETLNKMLSWYIPSKEIPVMQQMFATFVSFLWELALHVNRQKYLSISSEIYLLFKKYYFGNKDILYPSYDDIINTIYFSEEHTEAVQYNSYIGKLDERELIMPSVLPEVTLETARVIEKAASLSS